MAPRRSSSTGSIGSEYSFEKTNPPSASEPTTAPPARKRSVVGKVTHPSWTGIKHKAWKEFESTILYPKRNAPDYAVCLRTC